MLTIALATGAKAQLDGKVLATGNLGAFAALRSADAGAIVFRAGSRFNAGSAALGFTGAAFVSATAGSVVFQAGAYYAQYGGSNPFGMNNNAVFNAGSYYRFNNLTTGAPSLSGRTYGYLIYNAGFPAPAIPTLGSSGLTVQNDLVVNSGSLEINLNATSNFQGNIVLNGTGAVAFTSRSPGGVPAGINVVRLNGSATQTIGGNSSAAAAISFADNATLQISNSGAGVTLARPLTLPGTLALTSGLLTTDATNILTLGADATVSASGATAYVNGPLQWNIFTTNSGPGVPYFFPIGKGGQYRPLTLRVNTLTAASGNYFRAEQFEGDPGGILANPDPSGTDLVRVSAVRYFDVTPYQDAAGATPLPNPTNFIGTITLSFGPDDAVNVPNDPGLVVAKRSFDYGLGLFEEWRNFGRSSSTGGAGSGPGGPGVAGTITSNNINSFSQLALGATNAASFVNPLPVQLTSFAAARAAGGPVQLRWATASEANSARFEVERSADGLAFTTVATVAAAGSSAQPRRYAALDAAAPASALYYRLRLVDQDGRARYSAPVGVAAGAGAADAPALALFPSPARDALYLRGEATPGAPYVVRAALGQVVRAGQLPATEPGPVAVAGLPAGVYFFELQTPAGRVVRRFVKE